MSALGLLHLKSESANAYDAEDKLTRILESTARIDTLGLFALAKGRLAVVVTKGAGKRRARRPKNAELVAELRCRVEEGVSAWYLVPRSHRLQINGHRPYPIARLEPGVLLSIDADFWLVAQVWQPQPRPAPEDLADRRCPVCGAKLSVAPVVQCGGPDCGRWTHYERPDEPDGDFLNCFLATDTCPDCEQPVLAEAALVPEPHDKLLAPAGDERW
jgi:hypothetical protein